ncbi:hypothetical protein EBZ39_02530 [bacterium]|nr:hypothetical protein [bacterium]
MLTLTYSTIFLCVFFSFAFGYVVGRVDLLIVRFAVPVTREHAPMSFAPAANTLRAAMTEKDSATGKTKIEIDTGKYVGEINTGNLQKTQQLELGKTIQTQDDISLSVSKLAQLKGK